MVRLAGSAAIPSLALAFALALATATASAEQPGPVVSTPLGQLSGIHQGHSNAYLGIPYAQPPVGDWRWRAPREPQAWSGVRDGSHFGANCYQGMPREFGPFTNEFIQEKGPVSEDCLYLNVWTPEHRARGLPVLVWIHGGGFGGGSGSIGIYDGGSLAAKGAVVITINYRVGAFGFLAHPELAAESPRHVSGNYGLLDMMAALRWVQSNVASFGGDPARVTVAGQSAGAMAIDDLLVSPDARGLFSAAISESGAAVGTGGAVLASRAQEESLGESLLAKAGAHSIAEARRLPPEAILAASDVGPPKPGVARPPTPMPNLDGQIIPGDPGNPATPLQVRVPLLTGYNRDEGHGIGLFSRGVIDPAQFEQSVRERFGAQADRVLALYPHQTQAQAAASAHLLPRDAVTVTLLAWSHARTEQSGQHIYPYIYEHPYPGPQMSTFGTFHTSEVPYVFGVLEAPGRHFSAADQRISAQMQSYWLQFMRTGDPNGAGGPHWPEAGTTSWQIMGLGDRFGARPAASTPERLKVLSEIVGDAGYQAFP